MNEVILKIYPFIDVFQMYVYILNKIGQMCSVNTLGHTIVEDCICWEKWRQQWSIPEKTEYEVDSVQWITWTTIWLFDPDVIHVIGIMCVIWVILWFILWKKVFFNLNRSSFFLTLGLHKSSLKNEMGMRKKF